MADWTRALFGHVSFFPIIGIQSTQENINRITKAGKSGLINLFTSVAYMQSDTNTNKSITKHYV